MWALVQDNEIAELINKPKGMVIGDTRHSRKIFELWSKEELESIGIYDVVFDDTNKKDQEWYINTDQSFNFADGQVTASYGTATPKQIDDTFWTQEDADDDLCSDDEVGKLKTKGVKSRLKENIKQDASGLLSPTDWYVIKANEIDDYSVPSKVTTFRADVRTKSNEMETAIENASDISALETLYTYVNNGTEQNPIWERPLGEFPTLEI